MPALIPEDCGSDALGAVAGRSRAVRPLRSVPAELPDVPADRLRGGVAPRAYPSDPGAERGSRRRRTPTISSTSSCAWSAATARACARVACRSGASWRRGARSSTRGPSSRSGSDCFVDWRSASCCRIGGACGPCSGRCSSISAAGCSGWCAPAGCCRSASPTPKACSQTCRRRFCRNSRSIPPKGPLRYRVGLFTGCVMPLVYGPVHAATLRVLRRNGCEVHIPRNAGLLRRAERARR